ncbi:hypothetical protein [Neisseria meningitidis]|uniref:hypothetical protein n=1 Tax=Neisseria meningitidis TaxID=487 RepID=UPI002880A610|nr:hypothetical protein [Neisseria meningitidis]
MKLEASKQKFKKSFIISLFFSILYTSPLLAVDYVYDKTKLTDDEITRLKKLRDRNSEYWKDDLFRIDIPKETGLRHDIEGAAKGNFSYPIFYIPTDDKPIDPDKKISFFDSPYTPGYTAAFVQGFGVKERNGYTEEQAKKYIDELRTKLKTAPIIAAAQLGYFQLNDGSGDSWLYNYYRNDIFNSYGEIKHSNINSEILAVGNVADLYYKHFIRNPFIYVDWSIFSLPLPRLKVSENSHVIGQIIHLYRLDLEDSLWEPRWDSDVSYLNLFNSHIRFNTKNDSLVVGESRIRPTPIMP